MTAAEMLKMSQTELDDLFTKSAAGEIPKGEAKGTAIVAPGTTYSENIANFVNHFAWQGKVFDPEKGVLRNKITPVRIATRSSPRSTRARAGSMAKSASCSIIPRPRSSLNGSATKSARSRPRTYLGKVYWSKKKSDRFRARISGSDGLAKSARPWLT